MPHPRNAGYRRGENWSCCPVCGNEYRASAFRKRWDGLWVCAEDYEERHPQDLLRVTPDDMRPAVVAGPQDVIDLLPDIPECVTGLQVEQDDGDLNLSWDAVGNATSYDVRIFPENDPISEPVSVEVASYTVSGLKIGSYTVMVNARNASGVGSAGIATSGQGRPGCSTTPATVEPYTVVHIFNNTGTYVYEKNPLATSLEIRLLGGAGGGGGACGGGLQELATGGGPGGGGGGGAGRVFELAPADIPAQVYVVIGEGGDGGEGGATGELGSDGEDGEPSSFHDYVAGGGGGGAGGDSRGSNSFEGGGGGGGIPNNGSKGQIGLGGAGGTVGGAQGSDDLGSSGNAEPAEDPSTDFGGGGGGGGDLNGTQGSVSLWGGPGGGGGSHSAGVFNANAKIGASGTPSTGAPDAPQGGAPNESGANGVDPEDPLMLAGSSGAGGGGSGSHVIGFNTGLAGGGGDGGRGAGGGGGGCVYASLGDGGDGGKGGNGYCVVIEYID